MQTPSSISCRSVPLAMDNPNESCSSDMPASDTVESKRTCKSCNLCKKMKIRCVRRGNSCSQCISRNVECTMRVAKKRKAQPTRIDYYGLMEDRLRRVEAVLGTATSEKNHGPHIMSDGAATIKDAIFKQAATPDRLSTLTNSQGSSKFVGASSGFSLFSPQGLQWIRGRVGKLDFERLITAISESHQIFAGFDTSLFHPTTTRTPLPPMQIAESYVDAYFLKFNPIFPLYDEASFRLLFSQQYSTDPPDDMAWYACFNMIVSLGCLMIRRQDQNTSEAVHPSASSLTLSWGYFRNASSHLIELIFGPGNLRAIQAMMSMTFMLLLTSDPNTPSFILAAACRMTHAIGLHRQTDETGVEPAMSRERKNVFWLVYAMESSMALRSGRPSAMHEQDIGIGLPDRPEPSIGSTFSPVLTHFHSMAILAVLENRANSELYSAKGRTRSAHERLTMVSQLDAELIRWRDQVPIEIRPECEIRCERERFTPIVMMHFAYYNCLTAIHRASIHNAAWTREDGSLKSAATQEQEKQRQSYAPRVLISGSICVAAARSVIGLLKHFDSASDAGFERSLIWMASYFPLSSSLVLFANTLQYPGATSAVSDIELMSHVTSFLAQSPELAKQSSGVLGIFRELNQIAALVVRDAQLKMLTYSEEQEHLNPASEKRGHDGSLDVSMTNEDSSNKLNTETPQNSQSRLDAASPHHSVSTAMDQPIETPQETLPSLTTSDKTDKYSPGSGLSQEYQFDGLNSLQTFGEIDGIGTSWDQGADCNYAGRDGNAGPVSRNFPWDLSYFWSGYQTDRS